MMAIMKSLAIGNDRMLSSALAGALDRRRVHYRWVVVGAPGILLLPLQREFGWVFAGHQLGAATAAFGAGLSRTLLDTYLPAFVIAGALCLVAALLAPTLARPRVLQAQPA